MNLATIHTRALQGINAPKVTVEVHLSNGLPSFSIVGLAETAVKESRDRVRSALLNCDFDLPTKRIVVNLSPADLPKSGGRYDLAIAIGILLASEQLHCPDIANIELVGELGLTGDIRPVQGILPFVQATQQQGQQAIVPLANAEEAGLLDYNRLFASDHLTQVCAHLSEQKALPPLPRTKLTQCIDTQLDLSDVIGQDHAKRALILCAAGGHNSIFYGPPGTGKTLLASRLPGILPPLTNTQAIDVASLASLSGKATLDKHFGQRPFRHPHHSATAVALTGGGSGARPGEISLAHHGVLFLDELPEFNRAVLEMLREPLESGQISIARANYHITFPARFQLIAAMNPCPCGYFGSTVKTCQCTEPQRQRYRHKLSGPLLDRFDLQVEVAEIDKKHLQQTKKGKPTSPETQRQVTACQNTQLARQGCLNAHLDNKTLMQHVCLSEPQQHLLNQAIDRLSLSLRAYHRILKIARTIADFEQSTSVETAHLSEAIQYRRLN